MWACAVYEAARVAKSAIDGEKCEKEFEDSLRLKGLSELEVQTIMNERKKIRAINANTAAIQSQPAPQDGLSMSKVIFWGSVFSAMGNNNNS